MPQGCPSAETDHRTKGLLRLTMACNERCPFCNVPAEDYPRPTPDLAEVEAELESFRGEQTLTISGGEPTLLRRRLLGLVRRAREMGVPFVELQTNAVLIDAAYAAALAEAGVTSAFVSLLSDEPALHDQLAGLEGAFPRCLAGIDALLAAGVRVALNPVLAAPTQERLAQYVDFVARRLPGVRSISLSAVQPHGRAARNLELLPDYSVLARQVPLAQARAAEAGIELLNPYCGLPLCVGWQGSLERCVEVIEARAGGWRERPGLENRGDKAHGPPCGRCALRRWCGGAWHAYWRVRGGAGIAAPAEVAPPWSPAAAGHPFQVVVSAPGGPGAPAWAALEAADRPTAWLWTDRLSLDVLPALYATGCTHLALQADPAGLADLAPAARALAALLHRLARDGRVQVHLAVRRAGLRPADAEALQALTARLGLAPAAALPAEGCLA